jgi:hypothetical protein
MTTLNDARDFLVELISQLFHADVLITEQPSGLKPSRTRLSGCGSHWPGRRRREPLPGRQRAVRTAAVKGGRRWCSARGASVDGAVGERRTTARMSWGTPP